MKVGAVHVPRSQVEMMQGLVEQSSSFLQSVPPPVPVEVELLASVAELLELTSTVVVVTDEVEKTTLPASAAGPDDHTGVEVLVAHAGGHSRRW